MNTVQAGPQASAVGQTRHGRDFTASPLPGELDPPLHVIQLNGLITKYLGETAAKLRFVFEAIQWSRGVYLFDEFDALGGEDDPRWTPSLRNDMAISFNNRGNAKVEAGDLDGAIRNYDHPIAMQIKVRDALDVEDDPRWTSICATLWPIQGSAGWWRWPNKIGWIGPRPSLFAN